MLSALSSQNLNSTNRAEEIFSFLHAKAIMILGTKEMFVFKFSVPKAACYSVFHFCWLTNSVGNFSTFSFQDFKHYQFFSIDIDLTKPQKANYPKTKLYSTLKENLM